MSELIRSKRWLWILGASLLATLLAVLPLASGVLTGTILGSVLVQATGQPITGASVSIRNVDTGGARTLQTDADGNYRFDLVPLGPYEIRAEASNYKTLVRGGIESSIATIPIVQFSMAAAAAPGQTEEGGGEVIVNLVSATLGAGLPGGVVSRLPLGPIERNYDLLGLTLPGVNTRVGTTGGDFATNGQRTRSNSFTIDGSDNNDILLGIRRGTPLTFDLPQTVETVQELQFLTANPTADYGRNPGANVNLVSRSGGNAVHGEAYYFYGGENLNARNFFEGSKTGLTLNRYGLVAGGPFVKERTFWFIGFQQQWVHERFGQVLAVPSDALRQQLTNAFRGAVMQEVLSLYPRANSGASGFARASGISTDNTTFSLKLDHNFTSRHRLSVRYNLIDSERENPTNALAATHNIRRRNQDIAISLNSFFTDRLSNQLRFSYGRSALSTDVTSVPGDPQRLGGAQIVQLGVVSGGGLQLFTQVGGEDPQPRTAVTNTFQYADSLFYTRGRHTLKAGFDIRRNQLNLFNRDFGNFHRFRPFFLPVADLSSFVPRDLSSFTQSFGSDAAGLRNTELDFFFQDDIRVRPGLMLNLGIRYEVNTAFSEVHDRIAEPYQTDKNNWGPRLGIAWDPFGSGKTAIRAGYAILFDTVFGNLVTFVAEQPPLAFGPLQSNVRPLLADTLANPLANIDLLRGPLPVGVFAFLNQPFLPDPALRSSYSQHYNLSVEREVMRDATVSLSYVGTRGTKLLRTIGVPVQLRALPFLPPFSATELVTASSGNSTFNALQLTFTRRFRRGLFVRAEWTYGTSIDDASDNFSAAPAFPSTPNNPANLRAERALSNFDSRHRFVISYVWEIPGYKDQAGLRGKLLGGWQVSGITVFATGSPFSLVTGFDANGDGLSLASGLPNDRPNALAGAILDTGNRTRPLQLAAGVSTTPGAGLVPRFGQIGTLGRNTEQLEGINNFDVAIAKRTRLREGYELEFRADFFNLFNRTQMGVPNAIVDDPNFGRITDTLSSPRNIQLSLRLHF